MAKKQIRLGFAVGTGEEVNIPLAHLVVTGITNESGKTTCLLGLIKRSGSKAIIFRTKIGEKAITEGTVIPPYYKDEFDWEYASDLLEASRKEKLKFERSWIIRYSKTAGNLIEFKANIDKALADDISGVKKLRELDKSVLITLQAYLEKVLPEIQYASLSNTIDIVDGINIMDLERFKEETQALIIKSVLQHVLKKEKNTWVILPECWKYLPEGLGNPVKRPAEAFIRQGATNGNYLLLDSQDITGVEKSILKQVSNWVLGYQREVNEIKRTLDQIPMSKKNKPTPDEIATLKLGQFYVATSEFTKKVYAQPVWLDDEIARNVALGKIGVEEVQPPTTSHLLIKKETSPKIEFPRIDEDKLRKEIVEMKMDFFNKIQAIEEYVQREMRNRPPMQPSVNIDEVVAKVLQKMPVALAQNNLNNEAIIQEVLKRVPVGGGAVYEVAPLEKLKKSFLEEAKQKVLSDISQLSDNAKRMLKYLESQGKGVKSNELEEKCFFMKHSGSATDKVSKSSIELRGISVADKDTAGFHRPRLRERLKDMLERHGATDPEVEQVYNHIIHELI